MEEKNLRGGHKSMKPFYSRLLRKPVGTTTNEQKIECWRAAFAERNALNQTVTEYCLRNEISPHTYSYWQDKIDKMDKPRNNTVYNLKNQKPIELPVDNPRVSYYSDHIALPSSITVELNGATIRITSEQDIKLLAKTFQALSVPSTPPQFFMSGINGEYRNGVGSHD